MVTILIVEDSPAYRQSLKEMLGARFPSARVEEAADGAEAWRSIATKLPDLIFMDVRLAGENGLDLTKRIKQDHHQLPIIIITNYDLAEYREAAYENGADYFLPKESTNWQQIAAIVESLVPEAVEPVNDPYH
jgi:two-component system response regulator NreC